MKVRIKRSIKEGTFTDAMGKMVGDNFTSSDDLNSQSPVTSNQSTQKNTQDKEDKDEVPDEPYVQLLADKDYQVKRVLGSGMFGTVVLAADPKFRDVAVKVLKKGSGIAKGPRNFAFKREIRNYQTVQSVRKKSKLIGKHFPKVFDIFTEGEYGFIVLELLTDKGVMSNLVRDIFQGGEALMSPTGDSVEVGVYKNLRRRLYSYLIDDKSRNKIIAKLLDGASEDTIKAAQQELTRLPFLELPAFNKEQNNELSMGVIERLEGVFSDPTAQDAFKDNEEKIKREFSTNPGVLMFIIKLMETVRERDITFYHQSQISIAISWINFIRKESPIGVHNRPELRLKDKGGADPEVGDVIPEAASIRKALEELEKMTGLAGRDMHEKNVMIRPSTGDIVIVDLGLFKPRADIVSERRKKRKKSRKRRPRRGAVYYGMGYGITDYGDYGGDAGGGAGGGGDKRDDSRIIKVRIVKNLEEKKKKDPVSDEISKLRDKGVKQDQAVAIALSMDERGELDEKFSKSERAKRAKKCDNPKGFTMKQFCKIKKPDLKRVKERTKTWNLRNAVKKAIKHILKEKQKKCLESDTVIV